MPFFNRLARVGKLRSIAGQTSSIQHVGRRTVLRGWQIPISTNFDFRCGTYLFVPLGQALINGN